MNHTGRHLRWAWLAFTISIGCKGETGEAAGAQHGAVKAPAAKGPTHSAVVSEPEMLVAKLNATSHGAEALLLMTGPMKASFASFPPEKQALVLKSLQTKDAPMRTLAVSDALQFVIVDRPKTPQDPIAFHCAKVDGEWRIANRTGAGSFVVGLLTGKFAPEQFDAKAVFQLDGETFIAKSAFATFEKTKTGTLVTIKFFPFPLQQRDLEFLKTNVGEVVQETGAPTTIVSSLRYADFDLRLSLDENNELTGLCHNGGFFPDGRASYSQCTAPNEGITELAVTPQRIKVVGKGELETVGPRRPEVVRWDVDVNVPLFKKGWD
jgi:hypothetical protein